MSQPAHLDDETLAAFVDGTLGEHSAVHAALHLDACPLCTQRALQLDPLQRAFASCADPAVPDQLVASVLAAAEREAEAASTVPALFAASFALLGAAALLLMTSDPLAAAVRLPRWWHALSLGAQHAAQQPALWFSTLACLTLAAGTSALTDRPLRSRT